VHPGLLVSSVVPGPGGGTIDRFRNQDFGHGVSFNQRFGGWHITGKHPFNKSWANQTGIMINNEVHKIANPPGKYFSWNKYLTNESHIVPHLIFEHQIGFINRCISTSYRFRELQLNSGKPHFRQHEKKLLNLKQIHFSRTFYFRMKHNYLQIKSVKKPNSLLILSKLKNYI
jgi:hypothetical protein